MRSLEIKAATLPQGGSESARDAEGESHASEREPWRPRPQLAGLSNLRRTWHQTVGVLLVEDDPVDRSAVERVLRTVPQWQVFPVGDLASARDVLEGCGVDIVLADLQLPDGIGFDLLPDIGDMPMIILTGTGDENVAVKAMKLGVVDYLVKDIDLAYLSTLLPTMQQALLLWEQRRAERELIASSHRAAEHLRELAARVDELLWIREVDGRYTFVSAMAQDLLGVPSGEIERDAAAWLRNVPTQWHTRLIRQDEVERTIDYQVDHPELGKRWLQETRMPVLDEKGRLVRTVGATRDVTDLHRREAVLRGEVAQLEGIANHDPLTSVRNRVGLWQQFVRERDRCQRNGGSLAIAVIDFDGFKKVNDLHGHDAGDALLQHVAAVIQQHLRPTDVLGRMGGDEFVVLMPDTRVGEAIAACERLRTIVAESPLPWRNHQLRASVSIGVGPASMQAKDLGEVIHGADLSLLLSKAKGRNRVTGSPSADALAVDDLLLPRRQPVFAQPIRRLSDRQVIGQEVVCRGPGGEDASIVTAVAKLHDHLVEVDIRRISRALSMASRDHVLVHVDVQPATMIQCRMDVWERLLADVDPTRVCLELPEPQLIGLPVALQPRLRELRQLGVQIALDDVGFGRSSLDSLILLEPAMIKLSEGLVVGAGEDPLRFRSLVRVAALAVSLEAVVVCTDIRTEQEFETLRELQFFAGQGPVLGDWEEIVNTNGIH
ncbi:MAG TPA: diguanylate cyclase [Planctomycetota bacterium]